MNTASADSELIARAQEFLRLTRPLSPVPPFPLDALPGAIRRYVAEAAAACGAPPDFVAVAVLGLAEGTIGSSRQLIIKEGFDVSPGGWYGIIGDPGTAKTPAMKAALRLIEPLEREANDQYKEKMENWRNTPKEERGPTPRREHFFVTDSTMEALGDALDASPGVTQFEDELLRRLKSLDTYRKGGDRQALLSMWSNAPVKIARRTTGTIYIPAPCAPIVGATQPGVLARLRGDGPDADADDGWVPRYCLSYPDADVPEWSEASVSVQSLLAAQDVFRGLRLYRDTPLVVRLSPEAHREWVRWQAENRVVIKASHGLGRQWAAKASFHLARLTLTIHALATANIAAAAVSLATMQDGIALVEYFRSHLARVLPAFGEQAAADGAGLAARVLRALSRHGRDDGWVSVTDLHRALGNAVPSEKLHATLDALLTTDQVEHRQMPTATKPVSAWRLASPEPTGNGVRRIEEYEVSPAQQPLGSDSPLSGLASVPENLRQTVSNFLALSPELQAAYRHEIAMAGTDDGLITHDRMALVWADRLLGSGAPGYAA